MCVEKNLAIAKNAIDLIPSHVVIYVPTPKKTKRLTLGGAEFKNGIFHGRSHIFMNFPNFVTTTDLIQTSDEHSTQKCSGLLA